MNESLDQELEALIRAERERPAPSAQMQARVWAGVEARVFGDGPAPESTVAPRRGWMSWATIGAGVVVGAALWARQMPDATHSESRLADAAAPVMVGGAEVKATRDAATERDRLPGGVPDAVPAFVRDNPRDAGPDEAPVPEPDVGPGPDVGPRPDAAAVPGPDAAAPGTSAVSDPPAARPDTAHQATPGPRRRSSSPPATTTASPDAGSLDELSLIEQAHRALASGDAREALRVVRRHRRRFPAGIFEEEAEALAVAALCDTEPQAAGLAAVQRFRQRWPRSVHAPLLERCGSAP